MKEYIEREALIEELNKAPAYFGSGDIQYGILLSKDIVEKQPIADVVEVVRCKGCQFGKYDDDEQNMILCKRILNITDGEHFVYNKLDDFCSYGTRKED